MLHVGCRARMRGNSRSPAHGAKLSSHWTAAAIADYRIVWSSDHPSYQYKVSL
jgi:hypothetical protein